VNVLYRESDGAAVHPDPGEELGAGGQARVVGVSGHPELVAKLYHAPGDAHARKLRVMLAHPPVAASAGGSGDAGRPALVWPADVLRDPQGRTVGLLMPRVTGMQRAFELYNPATRRIRSPHFDYARLHRTARNVAAAFDALHAAGYVVGDANESNVLVDGDGNVTVIDTDSFQVRDPATGDVFRCPVGRPEFAPPELQGRTLSEVDRTPEHDNFALGVLVFQLLMEGTHPFAGQYAGPGDPPAIPERIARGLFPYTPGGELKPPRNAPPLELLHPLVRGAVRRCFEVGHADPAARPRPGDWIVALDAAIAGLVTCGANAAHVHGAHLAACPWCQRAAALGGRDPFPSMAAVARGEHLKPPQRRARAEPVRPRMRGLRAHPPVREMVEDAAGGAGAVLLVALLVHLLPGVISFVALLVGASMARKVMRRSRPAAFGVVATTCILLLFWLTGAFASMGAAPAPPPEPAPGSADEWVIQEAPEPDAAVPSTEEELRAGRARVLLDRGSWLPENGAAAAPRSSESEDVLVIEGRGPGSRPRPVERVPALVNEHAIESILRAMSVPARGGSEGERTMAVVKMLVRADGTVDPTSVRALQGSPFDEVAVQSARLMRFRPAIDGGRPVDAWIVLGVHYPRPMP
jgi:hypothetical protein